MKYHENCQLQKFDNQSTSKRISVHLVTTFCLGTNQNGKQVILKSSFDEIIYSL